MTRKDFISIASILKSSIGNQEITNKKIANTLLAQKLSNYFKQDNPKFDEVKFLTACGVYDE